MAVNVKLSVDVLAHIELDPSSWNQGQWAELWAPLNQDRYEPRMAEACGTAFCAAGWACHLSGLEFSWRYHGHDRWEASRVFVDDSPHYVSDAAAGLLGIEDDEARASGGNYYPLFCADNDKEELYRQFAGLLNLDVDELKTMVTARMTELTTATSA